MESTASRSTKSNAAAAHVLNVTLYGVYEEGNSTSLLNVVNNGRFPTGVRLCGSSKHGAKNQI